MAQALSDSTVDSLLSGDTEDAMAQLFVCSYGAINQQSMLLLL